MMLFSSLRQWFSSWAGWPLPSGWQQWACGHLQHWKDVEQRRTQGWGHTEWSKWPEWIWKWIMEQMDGMLANVWESPIADAPRLFWLLDHENEWAKPKKRAKTSLKTSMNENMDPGPAAAKFAKPKFTMWNSGRTDSQWLQPSFLDFCAYGMFVICSSCSNVTLI